VILAGNAAIESMGGPVLGFCGGRIDDIDGSNSLILGPSPEQEELTPCVNDGDQGACTGNLGPTTVGLIYVNPAGHLDNPDPSGLIIDDIRSSFGKMGMNDTETLALAGGGHAFGKCHGACESPPCGEGDMTGKGPNTFTSGFEGAWTTVPTSWTNQYFTNLFEFDWKLITGPGGNPQWAPVSKSGSNDVPDIMMLTSDIALTKDPEFTKISQAFADDISTLDEHFQHAWYKLTTGDMGPVTRCLGDDVPPAQAFQVPLPTSPSSGDSDYIKIREAIQDIIDDDKEKRGCFINLASKCGNTYRETDYQGGCNGAFIRYDEDSKIQMELKLLEPVVKDFPNASFADILVLAGQVALEDAGSEPLTFCPGRNDATDKHGRDHLNPIIYDSRIEPTVRVKDAMTVKGLTAHQGVALAATPMGTDDLDNQHFIDLMKASDAGEQGTINDDDWALVQDEELKAIVKLYAESKAAFLTEFASGWTYLMTADRFNGPRNNVCSGVSVPTLGTNAASLKLHDDGPNGVSIALISVGSILAVIGVGALVMSSKKAAAVK
jgi:catalase-peroxidase